MSQFEPIYLPEELGGRVSQSFLRHYQRCPRSGFLYQLYRGQAMTRKMQRGRAFHMVVERAIRTMVEQDEATIPAEVVKDIVNEVLGEVPVPFEEHDVLREMSYRWASEWAVVPRAVVACETLFTLDVAGFAVRARVDYAALLEDGAVCTVSDWKTSRAAPPFEEVARKRSDGTLLAVNFQLCLYALVLAFGVPVREERCTRCRGSGKVPSQDDFTSTVEAAAAVNEFYSAPMAPSECRRCSGRGVLETPEPFPLASRAQRFDLEFVYPGIEDRDGKMLRRPMSLTRAELDEYRASLDGLLRRVAESERSGDWPAVVSDDACGECPAAVLCPIPREVRDHRGTVNTVEQAAEAAMVLYRDKADHRARQAELRAFAKEHGPVRFGGMVFELVPGSAEEIRDREAMFSAMDRAVRYGEPFDRGEFVRVKHRTDFKARDLTAEELGESEGSNGAGDGRGDLDERFGADAPF